MNKICAISGILLKMIRILHSRIHFTSDDFKELAICRSQYNYNLILRIQLIDYKMHIYSQHLLEELIFVAFIIIEIFFILS